MSDRRLKIMYRSDDLMHNTNWCQKFIEVDGVPADAQVVGVRFSPWSGSWEICLRQDSFERVPDCEVPPSVFPRFTVGIDDNSEPIGEPFPPFKSVATILASVEMTGVPRDVEFAVINTAWYYRETPGGDA
jgi:hypothetical protein